MDHRIFVSALVFLGKRGCWWIDLPPSFGKYKSIHARFTNWSRRGVFLAFFNAVRDAKDLSLLRFVDASFVGSSAESVGEIPDLLRERWTPGPAAPGPLNG